MYNFEWILEISIVNNETTKFGMQIIHNNY